MLFYRNTYAYAIKIIITIIIICFRQNLKKKNIKNKNIYNYFFQETRHIAAPVAVQISPNHEPRSKDNEGTSTCILYRISLCCQLYIVGYGFYFLVYTVFRRLNVKNYIVGRQWWFKARRRQRRRPPIIFIYIGIILYYIIHIGGINTREPLKESC